MEKKNILFIVGAPKTGTSTLVGMLNRHPNIFIFYETCLNRSKISKYAGKFLRRYPEARYLFRDEDDIGRSYSRALKFFREKGYDFKIIGDKFPDINKG
ncbi:MAG: sulfotransferase, partial [Patescibacteria group bacterium]|nr:sulfotransferase [Patescibacteria group bacterium]